MRAPQLATSLALLFGACSSGGDGDAGRDLDSHADAGSDAADDAGAPSDAGGGDGASDAGGDAGTAASGAPTSPTPEEDFAARCAAPGVVLCNGLDADADVTAGLQTAADGTIQGSIDGATRRSGGGSLTFRLRAGIADANIGGAWSGDLSHAFGVGETLYVQWRQRVSPEYLSNNLAHWRSSIKQVNLHGTSSTCQPAEFTTITGPTTAGTDNWASVYTDCGVGFNTDSMTNVLCDTTACPSDEILIQQGSSLAPSPGGSGYNCNYGDQVAGDGHGTGCFFPSANVWYTYYEKIVLGALDTPTTSVDAYVAAPCGAYLEFQRAGGITFSSGGDDNLSHVRLETYMTELGRSGEAATVDALVWYDELIVSTAPIAAPVD